ncbi:MAG: metallophosphoesterase [Prevotella sp.]|nr:metallophosphoesterase [Prevotella sp.]
MRTMWMMIFMALPILALSYISWHVWCLLPLPTVWKIIVVMAIVASFLLLFLNLSRSIDGMPMPLATAMYETGTSSLMILLYLVMLFLVLDLGRLVRLFPRTLLYNNWATAGGIVALMAIIFTYGYLHYKHKYREDIKLTTEKAMAKPLRLVMMSDLHLGYHNRREELRRWVDMINEEHADAILIAGDIIDMSMRPLKEEKMYEEFLRLNAPVYACLGNHEYYSGEPDAQQFYQQAGIHLLQDSCATVGDLCIVGRDDRTNLHRMTLADIMKQADHTKFTILLDHQPYHLEQAERQKIDFQFSGHTHHGQVWPISWITEAIYECAFGAHQRSNTQYYVSSGIGIWGGKFRIGTRSEYVVATISQK